MFDFQKPKMLLNECPAYHATPLLEVSYNDRKILLKDERNRMALGSFKALGGVYAVTQLIATRVEGILEKSIAPNEYLSEDVKAIAKDMTFVCASAGNHGISVAAGAKIFAAKSRIHLSNSVPEDFAVRLRNIGATVVRSGENYEQSIVAAITDAKETNSIHLADGSWQGYTKIPKLVMEGYTIIAEELRQEFEKSNHWPTHVYLQAGVGGLASAITFMIRHNWQIQPEIIIVEPDRAPCLAESIRQKKIVTVEGAVSNMGRLDCKTPSLIAFDILRKMADRFVTISDTEVLNALSKISKVGVKTTPSGIAGLAYLLKEINEVKRPLVIITEGTIKH